MIEFVVAVLLIWELYRLFNVDNLVTVTKYLALTKEKQKKVMQDNPDFRRHAGNFLSIALFTGIAYIVMLGYFYFESHGGGLISIVIILTVRIIMNVMSRAGIKSQPENKENILKVKFYIDIIVASTILSSLLYWLLTGVF